MVPRAVLNLAERQTGWLPILPSDTKREGGPPTLNRGYLIGWLDEPNDIQTAPGEHTPV